MPDSDRVTYGPAIDDRRAIGIERAARRRVDLVERDRAEQVRQPHVVVEAEAEELRRLQEVGDAGVGFERARHRADQVLPRLVQLLRRSRRRVDSRASSSSIDAIARSTLAGLTPARISSGPSMTLASKRAGDVVRHPLPLADAVAEPAADRVLAEHVVHQPEGVVRRDRARVIV